MKRSPIINLFVCGTSLVLCAGLRAQDASPSPAPSTTGTADATPRRQWGQGMNAQGMSAMLIQRLISALTLTPDQVKQVAPIIDKQIKEMMALRSDTSLTPEDRMAKVQAIRSEATAKVDAILTPEQQKKYTELQAQMRNRLRGAAGAGGSPAAAGSPMAGGS